MKVNERIIRVAIEFAKLSIHLVPKDEHRPRLAIEMAEKYLRDEVSSEEVKVAADAAADAADAAYAADAADAADAAYAAAHTAAYIAAYVAIYAAAYSGRIITRAAYAAAHTARAIAHASGAKKDTKEWHLKRLEVLKQCLVIAKRTFGLIR